MVGGGGVPTRQPSFHLSPPPPSSSSPYMHRYYPFPFLGGARLRARARGVLTSQMAAVPPSYCVSEEPMGAAVALQFTPAASPPPPVGDADPPAPAPAVADAPSLTGPVRVHAHPAFRCSRPFHFSLQFLTVCTCRISHTFPHIWYPSHLQSPIPISVFSTPPPAPASVPRMGDGVCRAVLCHAFPSLPKCHPRRQGFH